MKEQDKLPVYPKFQRQLILLALLPVVIMALMAILFTSYGLQSIVKDLVIQRNTVLIELTSASIAQKLEGYQELLEKTSGRLQGKDRTAQMQALEDWKDILDVFEGGVTLLDEKGVAVAATSNNQTRLGLNYSDRDYFIQAKNSHLPVFSHVLQEKPSGRQAVVIAHPMLLKDKFSGLLIGVFFLDQHLWSKDLEIFSTLQRGKVYLVDSKGEIIYSAGEGPLLEIKNNTVMMSLIQSPKSKTIITNAWGGQDEAVMTFAPLLSTDWGILMEEPWQALLNPVFSYLWIVISILFLGLGISTFVLVYGLNRFTRPLANLIREARAISSGAAFQPLPEEGPGEVSLLIKTFNEMIHNLEAQRRDLRQYAMRVLESQEDERRRLSRDLHDETVQDLVGLAQRLELCRAVIQKDPQAARRRLDELQSLTTRAVVDVRRISNDLRPLALEDLGLVAAAKKLCDALAQDMPVLDIIFEASGEVRRLAPETELIAFRIIQEALNNIRKHCKSVRFVEVLLDYSHQDLFVIIKDNGEGFKMPGIDQLMHQGHLGLAGMVERASLLDGELKIESIPGQGTQIKLRLPALPVQPVPN
jgi:signal transduction histidine kinase